MWDLKFLKNYLMEETRSLADVFLSISYTKHLHFSDLFTVLPTMGLENKLLTHGCTESCVVCWTPVRTTNDGITVTHPTKYENSESKE